MDVSRSRSRKKYRRTAPCLAPGSCRCGQTFPEDYAKQHRRALRCIMTFTMDEGDVIDLQTDRQLSRTPSRQNIKRDHFPALLSSYFSNSPTQQHLNNTVLIKYEALQPLLNRCSCFCNLLLPARYSWCGYRKARCRLRCKESP